MPDLHYEHPALAEIYDVDSGWAADRDFYLALAGRGPRRVLDLGCGTGLLCEAYASRGHDVTGVDPAKAMLDVAKARPYGSAVRWIEASAPIFTSDSTFDLIVMTGHAFQVFLDDADILAAFTTMREHMAENAIIAFDTRNPAIDWQGDTELSFGDRIIRQSRIVAKKPGENHIYFKTRYRFPDKTLTYLMPISYSARSRWPVFQRMSAATSRLRPEARLAARGRFRSLTEQIDTTTSVTPRSRSVCRPLFVREPVKAQRS